MNNIEVAVLVAELKSAIRTHTRISNKRLDTLANRWICGDDPGQYVDLKFDGVKIDANLAAQIGDIVAARVDSMYGLDLAAARISDESIGILLQRVASGATTVDTILFKYLPVSSLAACIKDISPDIIYFDDYREDDDGCEAELEAAGISVHLNHECG